MKNRDLKVGGKIWVFAPYLKETEYYTIKSVKKKKTLVEVVVIAHLGKNEYEVIMYGHCSSSMLSGYDRKFLDGSFVFTCDYSYIRKETEKEKRRDVLVEAGRDLMNIVRHFK